MPNFATLALIYHWLLVLHIELLQPVVVAEIWVREQKLAPLGNVVVAHGSSVGAAVLLLFYREHKVKVAVNELVHLHARRARTTGIARSRVAQEIGLAKASVTRWKNGSYPTDATAMKLADYFGIDWNAFRKRPDRSGKVAVRRVHIMRKDDLHDS